MFQHEGTPHTTGGTMPKGPFVHSIILTAHSRWKRKELLDWQN